MVLHGVASRHVVRFGFDRRRFVLPRFSSVGISSTMHRFSLSFFSLVSFPLRLVSTYLWFQQVHHVSTCGLSIVSSTWLAFHVVSSTPSWSVVHPRRTSTTPSLSTGTKGRWADLDRRSKEEETKSIRRWKHDPSDGNVPSADRTPPPSPRRFFEIGTLFFL